MKSSNWVANLLLKSFNLLSSLVFSGKLVFAIKTPWKHAPQYYYHQTDSTMTAARRLMKNGPVAHGTLIFAEYQTAGYGRTRGSSWESKKGLNLLFNVILNERNIREKINQLPILCGLSVARTVEKECGLSCEIKWPNDVMAGGNKIAGCLCEVSKGWVSVGIGITCNQVSGLPEAELPVSSIRLLTGKKVDRRNLLQETLVSFSRSLNLDNWWSEVNQNLFALNVEVELLNRANNLPRRGVIKGVNSEGGLLIKDQNGVLSVSFSGSIRLIEGSLRGSVDVQSEN